MALFARCWFLIECILIPDGFVKWFYLSFYIHPFFLFFCQIFLCIKILQKWMFALFLFLPFHYLFLFVVRVLRRFLIITRSAVEVEGDHEEDLWYEVLDSFSSSDTRLLCSDQYKVSSCETPKIGFWAVEPDVKVEIFGQETISGSSSFIITSDDEETSNLEESFSPSSSEVGTFSSSPYDRDMEVTSSCTPLPLSSEEDHLIVERKEKETDPFYKIYTERMNWFDLLNQERTHGISAILDKKQYLGSEERILKSLESDVETVYVAQACLSWEALLYQYRKLEAIIASSADTTCTSSSDGALCSGTIVSKFQKFKILLERFVEDETFDGRKRYWSFIQRRSSLNSLLQVPEVSENVDKGKERSNGGELMIKATDVLMTIEKCIKAFWLFVTTEKIKETRWRGRNGLSWAASPLEDPRDLKLLHDLTHTLRKKELRMKDLKGKKRCWLRRLGVNPYEDNESQKKEMMFAMIELKLVSRVLMMSMISTSQLQWCQQKLNNIEFKDGKITRPCMGSFLFPPS